ncbi:uncharacterized protein LOC129592874 [Paramacrobiotus metropolitanus]|uniref:uncharacterized protein LOC129592874 n=1 Tax=Paramacrobiotus metropolitanus TaxID=2943436 RepID=UPI0024462286|nr:uncharacterized protein LOC129592874 [Paramacrobiotus metropolitanus]
MWLSDWVLVMFSWERLLVILCPLRLRCLQRVTVARIAILILLMLSLSFNMVDFVVNYEDPHNHMIGARYGFDSLFGIQRSGGFLFWVRQWLLVHAKAKRIPHNRCIGAIALVMDSWVSRDNWPVPLPDGIRPSYCSFANPSFNSDITFDATGKRYPTSAKLRTLDPHARC